MDPAGTGSCGQRRDRRASVSPPPGRGRRTRRDQGADVVRYGRPGEIRSRAVRPGERAANSASRNRIHSRDAAIRSHVARRARESAHPGAGTTITVRAATAGSSPVTPPRRRPTPLSASDQLVAGFLTSTASAERLPAAQSRRCRRPGRRRKASTTLTSGRYHPPHGALRGRPRQPAWPEPAHLRCSAFPWVRDETRPRPRARQGSPANASRSGHLRTTAHGRPLVGKNRSPKAPTAPPPRTTTRCRASRRHSNATVNARRVRRYMAMSMTRYAPTQGDAPPRRFRAAARAARAGPQLAASPASAAGKLRVVTLARPAITRNTTHSPYSAQPSATQGSAR